MPSVAILVPVVDRPHHAAPFMESFRESGAAGAQVYAIAENDDRDSQEAWERAGAVVVVGHEARTFAEKINLGYEVTSEDWIFLVGDDVWFHPGWLEAAFAASGDAKVIGVRGSDEPPEGGRVGHLLIEREYIDAYGASWDGPGVVCHTYRHNYVDEELQAVARRRDVYVYVHDAFVEHLHPGYDKAPMDEIYQRGLDALMDDWETWKIRYTANMRVGVYGVAPVGTDDWEAWDEAARGADVALLVTKDADTTLSDARNTALDALPGELDWCVCVDFGEQLQPGWRNALLGVPIEIVGGAVVLVEDENWVPRVHRRSGHRWQDDQLVPFGWSDPIFMEIPKFRVRRIS